ncbi:MAG: hypothetical protein ACX939_07715 [Hyphococcus sp.]
MDAILASLLLQASLMLFPELSEEQLIAPIEASESGWRAYQQHKPAIDEAERIGRILFEHDRAAARATDYILDVNSDNLRGDTIGWIEDPIDIGLMRIYFIGEDELGAFYPIYAVDVKSGRVEPSSYRLYDEVAPFAGELQMLARARMVGARHPFEPCSRNYNTVSFKANEDTYYVYLLAASVDPQEIRLGGNYRIEVSQGADEVQGFTKFTNSCIILRKDDVPSRSAVVAMMASHILTPYPNEIHVFLSLHHKLDFFIVTVENSVVWKISNGKISVLETD